MTPLTALLASAVDTTAAGHPRTLVDWAVGLALVLWGVAYFGRLALRSRRRARTWPPAGRTSVLRDRPSELPR